MARIHHDHHVIVLRMASFSCEVPNYKGESNEESASTFIVSTCQLLPKSSSTAVSDHSRDLIASTCPENRAYSICCGSSAEFYIRPLHPCIDDIDYLLPRADELAFSGNSPVLPSDASGLADSIMCLKIESCPWYPSFAQLQYVGKMKYNWKHKMYEFNHTHFTNRYWTIDSAKRQVVFKSRSKIISRTLSTVSGPAIQFKQTDKHFTEHDVVDSVWCPQWPNDAKNWPTRPRKFGWPMIDTISKVVQNGCHVVCVQNPCLKCDENHRLWRLSFSVAEVTLIQSWTQIQQIVYHLLRFFAKRELIQKDCQKEDEVLCTYHLKTLMLWTCEEMAPERWNTSSVITICFELLKKLSEWLKRRYCPNYFIPEANLFRETLSLTMLNKTVKRLNEFSSSRILCDWFVQNYILSFIRTRFYPSKKMQVIYPHFLNFIQPIFEVFNAREKDSMDSLFYNTLLGSNPHYRDVIKGGYGSGLGSTLTFGHASRCMLTASAKMRKLLSILKIQSVSYFKYCDILLSILHAAFGLGCGEISSDSSLFVELIAVISIKPNIIRSQYHNFPKTFKEDLVWCKHPFAECYDSLYQSSESRFHFLQGQGLMENLTGSESRSEFELVSFISQGCLRKALECEDSQFVGVVPAALAYLAALHFASSEYEEAMRLCLAVLSTETFHKEHYTLNAGCL